MENNLLTQFLEKNKVYISENGYIKIDDGIYKFTVYGVDEKMDISYTLIVKIIIHTNINIDTVIKFSVNKDGKFSKRFIKFLHSIGVKHPNEPYLYNPNDFINKKGILRIQDNFPVDFLIA